MRRRERRGHLVQDRRRSLGIERPRPEQVLDAAASEEPHDEIGGIRLSPVVVERNDVRVLELGDDLRLALEATDEVRMVRELGRDRLDRDLASDLRLGGAIDHAERALADLLQEPIAPQRLALEIELGVLAKDPLVQQLEIARRIDAELLRQHGPRPLERRQGLRLPVRSVQGEHQPAPESFAQWVGLRQAFELRDHLDVAAEVEASLDLLLERLQAELLEPRDLSGQGGLAAQVGEGGAAPELERLGQDLVGDPRVGAVPACGAQQVFEP